MSTPEMHVSVSLCPYASLHPFSTDDDFQKQKMPSLSVTWSMMSTKQPPYSPQYWMAQAALLENKCSLFLTKLKPHLIFPISKQARLAPLAECLEVHPCHPERDRNRPFLLHTYIKNNCFICNQQNQYHSSTLSSWRNGITFQTTVVNADGFPQIPLWPRQLCHCIS